MDAIDCKIAELARPAKYPDGTDYRTIGTGQLIKLARQRKLSVRDLEIAALEQEVIPERYARNFKTLSIVEQLKLLQSHVAVVGLGGLGGILTEILARLGVGQLTLIDGDVFEESNLNRQLFSATHLLHASKAQAARSRVEQVNCSTQLTIHDTLLTKANALHLLSGSQVIVDCLDSLPIRFVLETAARHLGVPLVSAAVAGMAGHVTTIFPDDDGLTTIYGDPANLPEKGVETSSGNLPQVVMVMAALEGAEVTKILLQRGAILRKKLLVVDLFDASSEILHLG